MQTAHIERMKTPNTAELTRLSRFIGTMVFLLALVVLAGWAGHVALLVAPGVGLVSTKFNAALCIAMLSVATILLSFDGAVPARRRSIYVLAAAAMVICAVTLSEYVFGLNLGIDQAIFHDPAAVAFAGRMGANSAVALILLGCAIAFVASGEDAKIMVGHYLATTCAIIAFLCLVGYFYDAAEFYRIGFTTAMSPATAMALLLLCGALVVGSRDHGFSRVIGNPDSAGFLVRRLLPPVIILPVLLGWLCLQGSTRDAFDVQAAFAILVTANVITLGILIALNSRVLMRSDQARELSQKRLRSSVAATERRIAERTAELRDTATRLEESEQRFALAVQGSENGILDLDLTTGILFCSPGWKAMLGYDEGDSFEAPRSFLKLIHPEDRDSAMALLTGHYKGDAQSFSAEVRMQHRAGGYRWMLSRGQAVRDELGRVIRMVGSQTDISEIKTLQQKLLTESIRDSMTGLYNRRHFEERMTAVVAVAVRHHRPLSICLCDVDGFKGINDRFGHSTGDRVLQSLAFMLHGQTRAEDVAARYGGDEFCILFPEVEAAQAAKCVERIRILFEQTLFLSDQGDGFHVTASFGLADIKEKNASQFIAAADRELYEAKARGRNRLAIAL